ncbi:hypothetical protein PIB30_075686 [Stylosanthes scabra]|uniref:Uncharacterized protein n=1 Tax=Stylosanthes scabra TaxID=79078 RepID=A0ABU6SR16_9FABA|nr:hypothetical protein [Stylosanthes scabra]
MGFGNKSEEQEIYFHHSFGVVSSIFDLTGHEDMPMFKCGEAKFGAEVAEESARNVKIAKKSLKAKSRAYTYRSLRATDGRNGVNFDAVNAMPLPTGEQPESSTRYFQTWLHLCDTFKLNLDRGLVASVSPETNLDPPKVEPKERQVAAVYNVECLPPLAELDPRTNTDDRPTPTEQLEKIPLTSDTEKFTFIGTTL